MFGALVQVSCSVYIIRYLPTAVLVSLSSLAVAIKMITEPSSSSFERAVQQDYEFNIGQLKRFSLRELQTATSNFNPKNILGQGGFGVVYRGVLPNRTVVAVKRLKDPTFTGEMQFQTEVEMIGLALHRNLLRLYGFCMTPEEKLLVYPYMPNGSVADRLRGLFCGVAIIYDRNRIHHLLCLTCVSRIGRSCSVSGLEQAHARCSWSLSRTFILARSV